MEVNSVLTPIYCLYNLEQVFILSGCFPQQLVNNSLSIMVVVKKCLSGCKRALPGAWDIGQCLDSFMICLTLTSTQISMTRVMVKR